MLAQRMKNIGMTSDACLDLRQHRDLAYGRRIRALRARRAFRHLRQAVGADVLRPRWAVAIAESNDAKAIDQNS